LTSATNRSSRGTSDRKSRKDQLMNPVHLLRTHARTLALGAMLALSVMSPLAVHVHAEANSGGSGNPSVPGDCTSDGAYQSADGKTNYKTGDNIPQGTKVHPVDGNGNVNTYGTFKCEHG